jgi:hypothetical protein
MSSNIKDLSNKIYSFKRETSFTSNFEFFIFQIQKSISKVLPLKFKKSIKSFLLFRSQLSFNDIKEKYKNIFDVCKNSLLNKIQEKVFGQLKFEYKIFFPECTDDFLYDIFENLKPKIFKSEKNLIKFGEKVEKLYFLLSGQIYAIDNYNKPIFTMMNNAIFGEYEFITNTTSCYNIKVDINRAAYGFVLDKKSWEKITKKHVLDTNNFIKHVISKRKKHLQWMISNNTIVNSVKSNNYSNSNISIVDNKNISNNQNLKNNRNNKNKKIDLISSIKDKNPKYDYSNISIIRNIDEFHREINRLEFNFIDNKDKIFKMIKYKCI